LETSLTAVIHIIINNCQYKDWEERERRILRVAYRKTGVHVRSFNSFICYQISLGKYKVYSMKERRHQRHCPLPNLERVGVLFLSK
jgi:hypothetical protein